MSKQRVNSEWCDDFVRYLEANYPTNRKDGTLFRIGHWALRVEAMVGSLRFDNEREKGWDVYATPWWEAEPGIGIAVDHYNEETNEQHFLVRNVNFNPVMKAPDTPDWKSTSELYISFMRGYLNALDLYIENAEMDEC